MKTKFSVVTPDGKIINRTSEHEYKFAVLFRISPDKEWGAEWRSDMKGAKSAESKWQRMKITHYPQLEVFITNKVYTMQTELKIGTGLRSITIELARCPYCQRDVSTKDGKFVTHGPARNGDLECPGSDQLIPHTDEPTGSHVADDGSVTHKFASPMTSDHEVDSAHDLAAGQAQDVKCPYCSARFGAFVGINTCPACDCDCEVMMKFVRGRLIVQVKEIAGQRKEPKYQYRINTFKNAGLQARWTKTRTGAPIIVARDPHEKDGTWYYVTDKMWDRMLKVGILEGFTQATLLGPFFSVKG